MWHACQFSYSLPAIECFEWLYAHPGPCRIEQNKLALHVTFCPSHWEGETLLLWSTEESQTELQIAITWGSVNDDRMCFIGWTASLIQDCVIVRACIILQWFTAGCCINCISQTVHLLSLSVFIHASSSFNLPCHSPVVCVNQMLVAKQQAAYSLLSWEISPYVIVLF